MATALLGVLLHFFIAFAVVATYHLAVRRLSGLALRPWIYGPIYGLLVYAVMNFIVIRCPRLPPAAPFDQRSPERPPDPRARRRNAGRAVRAGSRAG
jgi:hypothetical protein